jgi:murein DD-endopeptidase MepM/ murein hydrolase activator NlpD
MRNLVERLNTAPDLYTALRHSGAAPETLRELIAACDMETARRLRSVDQGLLRAVMRAGQTGQAIPHAANLRDWLARQKAAPLFPPGLLAKPMIALRTDGHTPGMPAYSDRAFDDWFAGQQAIGIGPYGERRGVYSAPQFADAASPERRMIHLGIDVFAPAMTPVFAPLPGTVRHVTYNADPLDYGHTLILEHTSPAGPFFTLYGHLAATLPRLVAPGQHIAAADHIADLGDWDENGGWAAHLHFQIMSDMLAQTQGNFFGVGHESLWDVWQDICIDPNLILRLPADLAHADPALAHGAA